MIQLWPSKKPKKNHSNRSSYITVMHQDNTKKLQQRDPANFWGTWAEAGGYRRRKTCWEREYYCSIVHGPKRGKTNLKWQTPHLKSGQGSMNTRPAKICTSFLLSICAQIFSHVIKDGAKFTTSPKLPQKLSTQKLPQHTGQVILLEKAQVGIQKCHVGGMYCWKKRHYLHSNLQKIQSRTGGTMVEKQNMPKNFRDVFWKRSNKPLCICEV